MSVTKEQLIACIEAATVQKKVKVKSNDFYAGPEALDDEIISYIDPTALVEALETLPEGRP